MSIRPWRDIARRQSRQIMVGNVAVGGGAPVTVQTMTNTPTSDAKATIDQIRRCEDAGVDIIRVSCPDVESTAALRTIVREAHVPIVADIHFHYKRALEAADAGAACLLAGLGRRTFAVGPAGSIPLPRGQASRWQMARRPGSPPAPVRSDAAS